MTRNGFTIWRGLSLLLGATFFSTLPHLKATAQTAEAKSETAQHTPAPTKEQAKVTLLQRLLLGAGAKDAAFKTPAAVTSVDSVEIERWGIKDTGDVLRTVPGVFTEKNARSPALSINIRGMQDFGRNAITIDGARQNLQVSGHGANGWVFVDQNLLTGLDVQRGIVSGAQGSGVIGGAVNFRTLSVDDVVDADRQWGVRTRTAWGSNGFGRTGMVAAGHRFTENLGVVGAISGRKAYDYRDGWGEPVEDSGQALTSGLFKVSAAPGEDQTLDLGAVIYRNDWTVGTTDMGADVKTFTAAYSYAPTGNELVDLKINAYHNDARFDQRFGADSISKNTNVEYRDAGTGANISNTSTFALGQASLAVEYGGEYYFDAVDTKVSPQDPGKPVDEAFRGMTPSADRGVGGVFSKATLSYGMVDLIGALRYDAYTLKGSGNNPHTGGLIPPGPFTVDKSEGRLNGKATLVVTPIDGLQLYGSYGSGFRPPAITETLMAGFHPGNMRFLRFRPNPFLKPEVSTGWEVGANFSFDDVLMQGDALRIKASYFDNEVENYITSVFSRVGGGINYTYMNMTTPSRVKGFELDATYDIGHAFAGLTYHDTDIRLTSPAAAFGLTLTPPDKVWTARGGIRLFDEKLTIGGGIRFVSESEVFDILGTKTTVPEYKLYDAFANYKFNENVSAFLTVQNITNEGYRLAKDNASQHGPGRVIMGGFSTKF